MLEIDAAYGEGGGQLVRTAVALAAVTGTPVHLKGMRARRPKPGLAAQHLTAVRAVAALCDASVEGLALGAQDLAFAPGRLRAGAYRFDVGTAGSVPLVLQALMPAMVASGQRMHVSVAGGTDIRAAPPLDYLIHVLVPLLARLGARVAVSCVRRGYYPRGGGVVEATVEPARLEPQAFDVQGGARAIRGVVHTSRLPHHVAARMRESALAALTHYGRADIDVQLLPPEAALGAGGAVVVWAATEHTVLGAGRVAQRGVPAEALGSEAGNELAADLRSGATLDIHAADQMLVYLALSGGGAFLTRTLTAHAKTTMWLIEQLLPVRFEHATHGALAQVRVKPAM